MARNSGTRTLPPASGNIPSLVQLNPLNNPNVTQINSGTVSLSITRADLSQFRGRLSLNGQGQVQVLLKNTDDNVGNIINNPQGANDPVGGIDQKDYSTTDQRKNAQAYFAGGVGIEKDLAVGGFIYGRIAAANTATTATNITVLKTNDDAVFYPIMTDENGVVQEGALLYADIKDADGNVIPNGGSGLTYNPLLGRLNFERGVVSSSDASINTMTGAFTVTGGVGIGQDINVGGSIFPGAVGTGSIGAQDFEWEAAYLNKVYSKFLGSTSSNLTIAPGGGMTDIIGDLRVRNGDKPIGTAPVVTNTLYVTMDGDDTNDGRAQDPSRACRTIGAAMKSPFYQPGTQILVSPGLYLEDNPLPMKPYTSVRGSDIRTTFIEPINKTQDLFHVNSGCYLNYMTFLNGRSGRLEGAYDERFNRGAYATAFPPLTGDDKIDLFQSPYIQNCTNQSGPWLKDGTMFRPNQTVQIPQAVAMGSWPANTASIVVNLMSGDLTVGQAINSGEQNPGFFNARTLLLANKPFIQSQTVAWVDATFNSGGFTYDQVKCQRDTGLILNAIAQDMRNDSTSDSTFAGIQYWNQDSYTGQIPNEITATIAAITYVKSIVETEALNSGGLVPKGIVTTNFNKILDILNNGTSGVTDEVVTNGLPTNDADIVTAYNAIIEALPDIQDATIDYIDSNSLVPPYTYNENKCSRDTGLIVDALALDLAYIGSSQSTFAAIQYWNQDGYTGQIGSELTTTTNAINYVKSLAQKIVVNDTTGARYQTEVAQVLDLANPGTGSQAAAIAADFTVITDILNGGVAGVTDIIVPNSITPSTNIDVVNAYKLLQANKEYLKAEAIAYVEATKTQGFVYNKDKCFRDTGLIVDAIAQDVLFAGTSQSTFAGLQYWNQDQYVGLINTEITTTTNAINWVKSIAQKIVVNDISGQRYHTGTQVTSVNGGSTTEAARVGGNFDIITDILIGGVAGITDQIEPNGLTTSTNARVWNAYNLLQANKSYLQDEAIAYVEATKTPGFAYNAYTCARDVGYIVDSVSFDLLYGGNRQSIQSGVYYYGYDGSSTAVPDEIPQTTAAYNHIKAIIPSIVAGTTITSYQSVIPQVTNLTPGNGTQAANAQAKVDVITSIITTGPSAAGPKTPIGLTKSADPYAEQTAKLLDANREFIQAEVIAYIDQAYPPGFQYDQAKCARDVDYMVDSVSFDLLHGGNKQAVQSGVYYFGYDSESTAIVGEIPQTTAAYNHIKELAYYIIQGIEVPSTYQYVVPQNTTPTPGSLQEVLLVQSNIDYIIDVINNGPSRAKTKTPISLGEASDKTVRNAAIILDANREFIQAEVVAYINTEWLSGYDRAKCRRDVGYIVNSVAYDLLHGGNLQSIKSGVYYYDYNSTNTLDATNEIPATTAAYSFIKSIIPNVVKGEEILSPFQISVPQETGYSGATDYEVSILQNNIDVITNIIRNGPSVAGPRTPTNMIANTSTGVLNAYEMLQANIPFIKAEVIAFLDQTLNSFQYNRQLCYRDAGIIVENMSYDMAFGGNEKSVENGLSYYRGVTSVIAGQEVQTIGAIDYIGELSKKIIRNEICPVIVPPVNTPYAEQVINTVLTGGEIASDSIDNLLGITTSIIANGPSVAPEIYRSTGPDAAFVSAEILMQANRGFIQEQTVNYINSNLCFPPKDLPYNQLKCRRDTRVVIDSIASDLLFPTETNSQATFAGLQYFAQDGYTGAIKEQLGPTISAMTYLRDMSVKIIQNITKDDDAVLGTYRYSNADQYIGNNSGSANEIKKIKSEFSNILSILNGRITGWTDLIEPNGGNISQLPSVQTTVDLLLNNIDYLAEEVVAYVNATSGYIYNKEKCSRDTGLLVDAMAQDLLFGGTSQSDFAGVQYWNHGSYTGDIPNEICRTTDAISYVKSIAKKIVTNDTSGVRYQSTVSQNTSLASATVAEANGVETDFNVILDILGNGTEGVSDIIIPNNLTASSDTNIQRAYALLQANKSYLQAEAVAYVDSLSAFTYDQTKCSRDTGLIVDALAFDILYPTDTDSQSTFAGLQYWSQSGYTGLISSELTTTTNAINFLKDEVAALVPSQATVTNNNFTTLVNILTGGTTGVTDIIVPNIAASTTPSVVSAYNAIISAKSSLISNVINHINSTNPGFTYDQTKCRRDLGYILDSIAFDLLHGGNAQSVQSAVYYYNFDGSTAVPNEIPQVTAAYKRIKDIVGKIVKGEQITKSPGNVATQVTATISQIGSDVEAIALRNKVDYIIDIIQNGPSVANEKTPISLTKSTNKGADKAFTLLKANRDFIKAEIIAYINSQYGPGFVYNGTKCRRDVGYMVDSVSLDLLYGGNKQAVQSGVYYWGYNGSSSAIPGEIGKTITAYTYMRSILSNISKGIAITPYQTVVPQVIGTGGTDSQGTSLEILVDGITNIIVNGPGGVTPSPMGLTRSTNPDVINAAELLSANRDFIRAEVIAFIDSSNSFTYDSAKCARDTGLILDAIAQDILFNGTSQTDFSGIQYWNHGSYVGDIASELTTTTNAINFVSELAQKIVVGDTSGTRYTGTQPVTGPVATSAEASEVQSDFNVITYILANGVEGVTDSIVPNDLEARTSGNIQRAYALLQANKAYIQAEAVAFVEATKTPGFTYDQSLCSRDVGYMIDSVSFDLLYGGNRQAIQSGVYYWGYNASSTALPDEQIQSVGAYNYLKSILSNIITGTAISSPYQTGVAQVTSGSHGSGAEVSTAQGLVDRITNIITAGPGVVSNKTPISLTRSGNANVINAANMIEANKDFLKAEIVAYVNANYVTGSGNYNKAKCKRDVGYIIQSVAFDLLYGGNRQSIQSGLCYYAGNTDVSVIPGESVATNDAFTFMAETAATLIQGGIYYPRQKSVKPVNGLPLGSLVDASKVVSITSTLTNIIASGPSAITSLIPISLTESNSTTAKNAYNILIANREFLVAETIAYLDQTYNSEAFNYDQALCYRDTGLIIDAVSQDILLGGNQKSIEAGVSYWNQGFNYVDGQISTTTNAINYARDLALKVIANVPVDVVTGTVSTQVINPFFQYGGDYMPQQAVARNFHTIVDIIQRGKEVAPPVYAGGGLCSITGLHPDDVKIAPKITTLDEISPGVYRLGLDKPTVGHGTNSTLYFGETYIYPLQDVQVERLSETLTGSTGTWNQRKIDPIGSMGGALIDGGVISDRSPIQSFVFDAFTQLNQGGIGMKITNNGYAQLVSVFTIFCSIGVICNNGGIASITNSNCNFGDISLLAKGYGRRDFSGTVVNPSNRAYPFSPDGIDNNGNPLPYLDQFYPEGFWPNNGKVEIFVPDGDNRPHIGQVMEVISPEGHINEQGFPGFLNATPSAAVLNTGTITLTGISTNDVYIGNTVYIRDQFGRQYDDNGVWYVATGTTVSDVGYNSITLTTALQSGGGDPTNPTFFTFYFCGNSYFTVLTSTIANNPYKEGKNILSSNSDPNFEGPSISQISAHVASITHLKRAVAAVVANATFEASASNATKQIINPSVAGGINARAFINLRFDQMVSIIGAPNIAAAKTVVPPNAIVTSGTVPAGAGSAVTLIETNLDFLADEVFAYVNEKFASSLGGYDQSKCIRDVKLILQQIIYDLQTGGNYNSVYSGLSYWSRAETYHIVELGEAVNRPDLFPDGSTVNFYQRSYISASGYLFEYVGAGTNYGALPQRGVADPVQSKETVQLNSGKVYFTSTDQNGDFRIGPGLVISQATGVLSGRTFVQSLYANMTPFILAIT